MSESKSLFKFESNLINADIVILFVKQINEGLA